MEARITGILFLHGGGWSTCMPMTLEAFGTCALKLGIPLWGSKWAFKGIIESRCVRLGFEDLRGIGTGVESPLGTYRINPCTYQGFSWLDHILDECLDRSINCIVINGGDGSAGAAKDIHKRINDRGLNIKVIFILGTVDGVNGSEYTPGIYAGAPAAARQIWVSSNNAMQNNLICVAVGMGRNQGHLMLESVLQALNMGVRVSAVIVPELIVDLDKLCEHLAKNPRTTMVAAEGVWLLPPFGKHTRENAHNAKLPEEVHVLIGNRIQQEMTARKIVVEGIEPRIKAIPIGYEVRAGMPAADGVSLASEWAEETFRRMLGGEDYFVVVAGKDGLTTVSIDTIVEKRDLMPSFGDNQRVVDCVNELRDRGVFI